LLRPAIFERCQRCVSKTKVFETAQALNSRVSQPEQARGQSFLIEGASHLASQCRHEGLMGELVATKQIAQALRLIGRWCKDRRAHRAVFGFADEYTYQQKTETVKARL
jgi:uncharacterized protein with PIN domain